MSDGGAVALVPCDEALGVVLEAARELRDSRPAETQELPLWDSGGRVLAAPVLADAPQPPFDRSVMDGFALRSGDTRDGPVALRLVGAVTAGVVSEDEVGPGDAMAITTGAPLPAGADAVEQSELAVVADGVVTVARALQPGHFVARRGEYVAADAVVVPAGRVVSGLTFGALASVGAERVTVFTRPRVTVVATGDELVPLGQVPGPGQIRDSNRHTLMGMIEAGHCLPVDGGAVPDDPATLKAAIRAGLRSDILVLSGGVSVGVRDLVAEALVDEGVEILLHRIRMLPGKPLLVGRHAGGLVFGLPGNPVSTFVSCSLFVMPAAQVLARRPRAEPWRLRARLLGGLPATGERTTFHPGRLGQADDGTFTVAAVPWRGSGDQFGYAHGTCLVRREVAAPAALEGELVQVILPVGAVE